MFNSLFIVSCGGNKLLFPRDTFFKHFSQREKIGISFKENLMDYNFFFIK